MNRRISRNGIEKLKLFEGFKNHVYTDSGGQPTIGVGHLLTKAERASGKIIIDGEPIKYRYGLSGEEILLLLSQDVKPIETIVDKLVIIALTTNQFDALVVFTFNIGNEAFKSSTLLKMLNKGLYNEVPAQLKRWVMDNGKVVPGLVNRRNNEIALWLNK